MGMTIAFVGSAGHIGYALDPAIASGDFTRFVVAPGSADDNMTGIYNCCVKSGKETVSYDDWRDILKNEKPDVLVNCTVCAYMAEITVAFFKAGANVFCEKPLARTLDELDAIEAAWRESGKVLLAMLPFRYEEGFRAAYRAVKDGVIGEVRLLNAQKSYKLGNRAPYYWDQKVYGGTIPWVGAHAIDFISFLSGEHFVSAAAWNSAKCNGGMGDLDVSAVCAFQMTNGVTATATIDYFRPANAPTHGDDRVRAVGTDGIIEVIDGVATLTKNGKEILPDVEVLPIFDDFMNQVRGGAPTLLSAAESLENARACLGARTAAERGEVYHF